MHSGERRSDGWPAVPDRLLGHHSVARCIRSAAVPVVRTADHSGFDRRGRLGTALKDWRLVDLFYCVLNK